MRRWCGNGTATRLQRTQRRPRPQRKEAEWQAEAAAAEALVETTLELVTVECRRCFGRFSKDSMKYYSSVCHDVCQDEEACLLRVPAGRRKRSRPEG